MKKTIVLATTNSGKMMDIEEGLKRSQFELKTLSDFHPIPPVVEDGMTFYENAYKKADFTMRTLGLPVIADDSGLIVNALGGAPGVYSARYAGENATDEENIKKLLTAMKGKTDRTAVFECVIVFVTSSGVIMSYTGRCEGCITEAPVGTGGFGYDPIFFHPESNKTFAEMSLSEKMAVSHRGSALAEMITSLNRLSCESLNV